jgi:ArsR family transcriptional regulator
VGGGMQKECPACYEKFGEYAKLFEALASPIRIGIIVSLCERPKKPKEIREELGIPQPLLSQHTSILKEVGIIEKVDKFNVKSECRLKDERVIEILKCAGILSTPCKEPTKEEVK